MRAIVTSLLLLGLAACNPAAPPPAETTTTADNVESGFSGPFTAASNTAMSITGDLMIEPGRLVFPQKGITVTTTTLAAADVTGIVGQVLYGESPPADFSVELRHLDGVAIEDANAAAPQLCGEGSDTGLVAISRDLEHNMVSLVFFSGTAPPVSADAVCATFLYAAPNATP